QGQAGKGGVVVLPFLDLNNNGRRDSGEPRVQGLKLHVNGGRMEPVQRDTIIRISGLEAYTHYYIEADKNSFENLAWIIRKPVIKVEVDPNLFRLVEIPVAVLGEISGTVYLDNSASKDG